MKIISILFFVLFIQVSPLKCQNYSAFRPLFQQSWDNPFELDSTSTFTIKKTLNGTWDTTYQHLNTGLDSNFNLIATSIQTSYNASMQKMYYVDSFVQKKFTNDTTLLFTYKELYYSDSTEIWHDIGYQTISKRAVRYFYPDSMFEKSSSPIAYVTTETLDHKITRSYNTIQNGSLQLYNETALLKNPLTTNTTWWSRELNYNTGVIDTSYIYELNNVNGMLKETYTVNAFNFNPPDTITLVNTLLTNGPSYRLVENNQWNPVGTTYEAAVINNNRIIEYYSWQGNDTNIARYYSYTPQGLLSKVVQVDNQSDSTITLRLFHNTQIEIDEMLNERTLAIYPNPTAGELNIDLKTTKAYTIYKVTGEKVAEGRTKGQIDITNLPAGYYQLLLYSKEGISTHTIQKL